MGLMGAIGSAVVTSVLPLPRMSGDLVAGALVLGAMVLGELVWEPSGVIVVGALYYEHFFWAQSS
jgi:hypothetical protein